MHEGHRHAALSALATTVAVAVALVLRRRRLGTAARHRAPERPRRGTASRRSSSSTARSPTRRAGTMSSPRSSATATRSSRPANPLRGVARDAAYLASILDTIDGPDRPGRPLLRRLRDDQRGRRRLRRRGARLRRRLRPGAGETVGHRSTAMNPGSRARRPATNLVVRRHPSGADGYINPAMFHDVFAADLPPTPDRRDGRDASGRPTSATLSQPSGPARVGRPSRPGTWSPPQDQHDPTGTPAVHGRAGRQPRRSRSDASRTS